MRTKHGLGASNGSDARTKAPARHRVPGAARLARRKIAGGVFSALAIALTTIGCSSTSPHARQASNPGAAAGRVWVCRHGQAANPCASSLGATTVTTSGTLQPATWPHSASASKFACFYVHGSDALTGMGNATMAVTHWDKSVAAEQAAPLSQICQVWAPSYRSQTLPTVAKGLADDDALLRSTFAVAYASVLPA